MNILTRLILIMSYILRSVFVLYLLIDLSSRVYSQECSHNPAPLTMESRIHVERPESHSRILSPDQRMKFHVEYHTSVLESGISQQIQSVVADVVDRVSRTLSVKQDPGNFLFETYCVKPRRAVTINRQEYCTVGGCSYSYCGEIMASQDVSEPCFNCNNDGENCTKSGGPPTNRDPAHYTLFVASLNASCQDNYIAYGYACRIDDITDRPVAGVINICPIGMTLGRERLMDTVQHEIFHALGFSSSMYGLYRDADGKPLTPREPNGLPALDPRTFQFVWSERVIRTLTLDWEYSTGTTQRSVQALVTPNVLREARAHFGCPTLMGVELEDGGPFGTSMSHFEKRILASESMNALLTPVRVFSRISLALMEDTGWYIPDYDLADKLNWGKDLGCDFVQKSCKNWIDNKIRSGLSPAPWCTNRLETSCHAEGLNVAYCNIKQYDSPISEIYQLFTSISGVNPDDLAKFGGNFLTDYCPFFEANHHSPQSQAVTDLYCTNLEIIDDCRDVSCMNGGVCRDVMDGYYCNCPVGYSGTLCDQVNTECSVNSDCSVNEVCSSNRCVCERNRGRDQNNTCIRVTDVKEYKMSITVTHVNGVRAVYNPALMGMEGEGFRHGIEYEIRHIINNDTTLRAALIDVITRSLSDGSIIVDLGLIFRENSSDSFSNITLDSVISATTIQSDVLSESGTPYSVLPRTMVVQDANECDDVAGNDCSSYAMCTNTDGSYECSCLPGYEDPRTPGVLPGRECIDVDECLSSPCLNEGVCSSLANRYLCECSKGYSGHLCQREDEMCTDDTGCGALEFCSNDGACECYSDYMRNDNGECIGAYFYAVSLTITTMNDAPVEFTTSLYDVTSEQYMMMSSTLKRMLLLKLHIIRKIDTFSFKNGTVVAEFNIAIEDPMSANDLEALIEYDLGDGNMRSGTLSLSVNPTTLVVTDVNECFSSLDNDCSLDAECLNRNGSYSCRCQDGYDDESLVDGRPGRVCIKRGGLSSTVIIFLSIGLGCVFSFSLLLATIGYIVCRQKKATKQSRQDPYDPRSPNHLPHRHTHIFDWNGKTKGHDFIRSGKAMDHELDRNGKTKGHDFIRSGKAKDHDCDWSRKTKGHEFDRSEKTKGDDFIRSGKSKNHELERNGKAKGHEFNRRGKTKDQDFVRSDNTKGHEPALPHDFNNHHRHEHKPRLLPSSALYCDVKGTRFSGNDMGHMDSPFMSSGFDYHEPPREHHLQTSQTHVPPRRHHHAQYLPTRNNHQHPHHSRRNHGYEHDYM